MGEAEFHTVPTPNIPGSKEAFLEKIRNTVERYDTHDAFAERALSLFGFVPPGGTVFYYEALPPQGRPETYGNAHILVNNEYYAGRFGEDYSAMIPYDIEHEVWEIFYTLKAGNNAEDVDYRLNISIPFVGTAHRLAIRQALRLAQQGGNLNAYIEWIYVHRGPEVDERHPEWQYILREAEKIRKKGATEDE